GRIYRVMHETTRRDSVPALSKVTPAQLVTTLSHPNGWWRDTAQPLPVGGGGATAILPLTGLAETAKEPRTRLHGLWTLDGLDRITPELVIKALEDSCAGVRR